MAEQKLNARQLEMKANTVAHEVFVREYAGWIAAGYDEDEANAFAQEASGDAYDAYLTKAGA